MKFFAYTFTWCIGANVGSNNFRVPLSVDSYGFLAMHARDPTTGINHSITLDTCSLNHLNELELTNTDGSRVSIRPHPDDQQIASYGMHTQLIRQFESVAVVSLHQNSFELILNITEGVFRASCFPGSMVTVAHSLGIFGVGYTSDFNRAPSVAGQFVVQYRTDFVAEVPDEIFDHLVHVLNRRGATSPDNNQTFNNCRRGLLVVALPILHIRVNSEGSIRLVVEDYISFNADGTCDLRLRRGTSPWKFNPLALPEVNIRQTSSEFGFCDSNF